MASRYTGVYALIFRLTVDNYHRPCHPADGQKEAFVHIPGMLHTDAFGDLVMIEAGALPVGKIVNHPACSTVRRGEKIGLAAKQ